MNRFNPYTANVPICPDAYDSELVDVLKFPSIVITYITLGALCLIFAVLTAVRYNSVTVFEMKVQQPSISNTMWILYFVSLFLRAGTDATRFALYDPNGKAIKDTVLVVISLVLTGLTTLFLSFALNHQRRHRSSFAHTDPDAPKMSNNSTPFQRPTLPRVKNPSLNASKISTGILKSAAFTTSQTDESKATEARGEEQQLLSINDPQLPEDSAAEHFGGLETPMVIFFLLYCLGIYAEFTMSKSQYENIFWGLFLGFLILQRIPVFLTLLAIIIVHKKTVTPTLTAKFVLTVAILVYLVNDVPITLWAQSIDRSGCIFRYMSGLDLIHALNVISQILVFVFLRMEYHRNTEDCKWRIVSQRGNGFDFRDF